MKYKKNLILKKIIKESIQEILNEGMTLTVKDVNYDRVDNLLDLTTILARPLYRIIESLPADQQNYYTKNRPLDLVDIDGKSDMYSSTGTINLYYSGYTKDTLKKFLKSIFETLKKLNIKHGKFKIEQSGKFKYQVIRIPVTKNDNKYTGAPSLQMSNRNAYHIFKNILQFEPDDASGSSFSFKPEELKERIEAILKHDPEWVSSNTIHKRDSSMPDKEQDLNKDHGNPHDGIAKQIFGNARIVNMGLDEEDIKDRLIRALEVANWAIEHKKELYVA